LVLKGFNWLRNRASALLYDVTKVVSKVNATRTLGTIYFGIKGCLAIANIFSSTGGGKLPTNASLVLKGAALVTLSRRNTGCLDGLVCNKK
jgi:hypothetical protein